MPCEIFALLHLQTVLPCLEFPKTQLFLKRHTAVWEVGFCPVLNSPADQKGKKGKKAGANISLYTVIKNWKHYFMHHSENTDEKVELTYSFLNAILLIFKIFFYGRSFKSANIKIQLCSENSLSCTTFCKAWVMPHAAWHTDFNINAGNYL